METTLIGEALVDVRRQAGLTQAEVARRMGTSQPAVARAEAGKVSSLKWLNRYALAVGRPVVLWMSFGEKRITPFDRPGIKEEQEITKAKLKARRATIQRALRRQART